APSRAVRVREAGAEHVIIETMDPLRHVPPAHKFDLARQLRREGTPMERYAWSLLRNHGVLKLKFRRQHVLHGLSLTSIAPPNGWCWSSRATGTMRATE